MPPRPEGERMSWLTIGEAVKVNARKYPTKLAFKDEKGALTFRQLDERTNRLANALLALGLRKGDKLSVVLQNCIEFAEVYLAGAKAGIVVVPVNWRLTPQEAEYVVNNSDAVRKKTVDKVLKAMTEVGYSPNVAARSLRSGRTSAIGSYHSAACSPV